LRDAVCVTKTGSKAFELECPEPVFDVRDP